MKSRYQQEIVEINLKLEQIMSRAESQKSKFKSEKEKLIRNIVSLQSQLSKQESKIKLSLLKEQL